VTFLIWIQLVLLQINVKTICGSPRIEIMCYHVCTLAEVSLYKKPEQKRANNICKNISTFRPTGMNIKPLVTAYHWIFIFFTISNTKHGGCENLEVGKTILPPSVQSWSFVWGKIFEKCEYFVCVCTFLWNNTASAKNFTVWWGLTNLIDYVNENRWHKYINLCLVSENSMALQQYKPLI
jgi:hypothetical protein